VFIDSQLSDGNLTYGELIIPGETEQEIFISTYICHPSMANDNLSGPAVTTYLAKWLKSLDRRKYTYRVIFIPETIGSIAYLSRNLDALKTNVIAGFNLTCIGDDRVYSYLPSRAENTLADRVAIHVLKHMHPDFVRYSFLDRGSDERQYCSPGVDLPVASVMRSKFGAFPEYHTSLDDLEFVTPSGLYGGYQVLTRCIEGLEGNEILKVSVPCEPQLGKRGLYPTLSMKNNRNQIKDLMNLIAYCDGNHTLLEVAEKIDAPIWELFSWVDELKQQGLLYTV
jgi:aminopeptidase-like protein